MNYAAAVPVNFFNEKGLLKEYRPPPMQQQIDSMNVLRMVQAPTPNNATSVSDSAPVPIPSPDFPFQEFPLTEVVTQSQIDSSSISDMSDPRETSNSSRIATRSTNFPLKSMQNRASHKEMREIRDLTVSEKHIQSTRDSSTISISDNSTTRKSISGIKTDSPTALRVETDISFKNEGEIQQLSNNRSVMPTDVQALTVLQDLLSDDFQAKNTHSLQRKGEDTRSTKRNEAFQLIQKIHNQLQTVQWDLQRLQSMHKYDF